jgi:hypothetical protein
MAVQKVLSKSSPPTLADYQNERLNSAAAALLCAWTSRRAGLRCRRLCLEADLRRAFEQEHLSGLIRSKPPDSGYPLFGVDMTEASIRLKRVRSCDFAYEGMLRGAEVIIRVLPGAQGASCSWSGSPD